MSAAAAVPGNGNRGQTPISMGKLGSVPYFLLLLALVLLTGCSRGEVFHHEAYVFGTRVDVAVHGEAILPDEQHKPADHGQGMEMHR